MSKNYNRSTPRPSIDCPISYRPQPGRRRPTRAGIPRIDQPVDQNAVEDTKEISRYSPSEKLLAILGVIAIAGLATIETSQNTEQIDPAQIIEEIDQGHTTAPPDASEESTQDFTAETIDKTDAAFIEHYASLAEKVESQYGVPADVVLAMGILESGHGSSELARNANNFHGLKANEEWSGDVYKKETIEHYTLDQIERSLGREKREFYESEGVLIPGTDKYEVRITAEFKKFPTAEEGFSGFGDHLKNRFDGQAYADAFNFNDPQNFFLGLVNDVGPVYATDVNYQNKVLDLIDRVQALRNNEAPESVESYDYPDWNSSDMDAQRRMFVDGEGNVSEADYHKTMKQLEIARNSISIEGYNNFLNNIKDVRAEVAAENERGLNQGYISVIPEQGGDHKLNKPPR